jgi:threonine/homoserine efflux transporter RhtA
MLPTDPKRTEQVMKVSKMNTVFIGIIEGIIFILIMLILGNTVFKPYQHIIDQYELFYVAFQFLSVPFLNLLFKNYKALKGNIIGILVGFVGPIMIAALFFGYRG